MCSPTRAAALLALLLAARAAGAQTIADLQRRADSLASLWREASTFADLQDRLAHTHAQSGRDTIRAGALVIITNDPPPALRAAVERAWRSLDSMYGSAARAVGERPLVIHVFDESDTTRPSEPVRADLDLPSSLDASQLTRVLLMAAPLPAGDASFQAWLGGRLQPPVRPEWQRAAVYVELVTAPSAAVRRCFVGARESCRDALHLSPDSAVLERWYDADQRRDLVARSIPYAWRDAETRHSYAACLEHHDDDACLDILRSRGDPTLYQPFSPDARQTLVQVALQVGGRDAYQRLLAGATHPMDERLAAAARVGVDSLIAAWRGAIVAARPRPVTLPPWGVPLALGWAAAFAACALRSSRWRLG